MRSMAREEASIIFIDLLWGLPGQMGQFIHDLTPVVDVRGWNWFGRQRNGLEWAPEHIMLPDALDDTSFAHVHRAVLMCGLILEKLHTDSAILLNMGGIRKDMICGEVLKQSICLENEIDENRIAVAADELWDSRSAEGLNNLLHPRREWMHQEEASEVCNGETQLMSFSEGVVLGKGV